MELTQEEKKLVYEAGLQGGLTPQQASSTSGYSPISSSNSNNTTKEDPNTVIGVGPNAGMTIGEYDAMVNNPNYKTPDVNTQTNTITQQTGESNNAYKQRILNSPFQLTGNPTGGRYIPEPIIQEGMYKGMTQSQANSKKKEQNQQQSALTSYSFTPESIGNTKKVMDDFNLYLDSNRNNPLKSEGDKQDEKNIKINLAAKDIAKGFNSPQDFYVASQNNPELQALLQPFINNGGSISQIASNITSNITNTNPQDVGTYLSNLGKQSNFDVNDPFRLKALQTLTPENNLAQEELMRQAKIAPELHDLYFGSEDQIGILQQKQDTANEKIKLLQKKEADSKATTRENAQYTIDKNNADAEIASAKIEQERLHAKNYMTGMLAKLGALKTTGAAPIALANVEQKYQQQKQELDTKLKFANRKIGIDLTDDLNKITEKTDDLIESVNEDLSISDQDARKKIFDAQQKAETKMYDIMSKSASAMRKQTETYRKEGQALNDKYISSFLSLAGKGVNVSKIPSLIKGNGRIDTSKLTNSMFAKKTSTSTANPLFSASELRKIRRAGIDPIKQQAKAIAFIDKQALPETKPAYTGETLSNSKRVLKGFLKLNYKKEMLDKVRNDLEHGWSLKQIAKNSGMSTELYDYLNKYIKQN